MNPDNLNDWDRKAHDIERVIFMLLSATKQPVGDNYLTLDRSGWSEVLIELSNIRSHCMGLAASVRTQDETQYDTDEADNDSN